jgi:uncharacterized protein (DUF427 family)
MGDSRVSPRPGQESAWDYPRPPRLEATRRHLRVKFGGLTIAETTEALRVIETSHPPVYYFPLQDVDQRRLRKGIARSFCEFKGRAVYWDLRVGNRESVNAAWSYPRPARSYEALAGRIAFYPGRVDACFVDGELVAAQAGDYYGGWITSHVAGPFKGGGGTRSW